MTRSPALRLQSGATLLELVVSTALAALISAGFFSVLGQLSGVHLFERRLTFYSSEVREAIHQIARDLRAAGSNPLSRPFLFDGDPVSDRALFLDPGGDGDISNDIRVQFDRYGGADANEPDGDADDPREAVMYSYYQGDHRISRRTRTSAGWTTEVILVNVCTFAFSFYDRLMQPTIDASQVSWVYLDATTTTAPRDCYQTDEVTRRWVLHVKLRNR